MCSLFSWLADDEQRGAVGDRLVLLVDGLELEGNQLHVVPDRCLRDLVGRRRVAPADPARVGHYCNSPWSFIASPMSPLTLSFCRMKAVTGFSLPVAMFIQSSVVAMSVVFGLCAGPWMSSGAPLAIFSVHDSPLRSNW